MKYSRNICETNYKNHHRAKMMCEEKSFLLETNIFAIRKNSKILRVNVPSDCHRRPKLTMKM